jgi:chromosomal replication initiation ATPase DnaA
LAAKTVRGWPDWPSPFVLVHGPASSGKTHLAAVWAFDEGALVVDAARLSVDWHADARLVVVDGLERLGSEEALFHLANAIAERGGALLLTSRLPAAGLEFGLADLRTRLKSAVSVGIGPPDEAFLSELLTVLAEEAQIAIDPAVAAYCIARMERTHEAAVNLISALNRRSLALKGPLTQKVAAEVLDELGQG